MSGFDTLKLITYFLISPPCTELGASTVVEVVIIIIIIIIVDAYEMIKFQLNTKKKTKLANLG